MGATLAVWPVGAVGLRMVVAPLLSRVWGDAQDTVSRRPLRVLAIDRGGGYAMMRRLIRHLAMNMGVAALAFALQGCLQLSHCVSSTPDAEGKDYRIGVEIRFEESGDFNLCENDYTLAGVHIAGVGKLSRLEGVDGVSATFLGGRERVRGIDLAVLGETDQVQGIQCNVLGGFSGPTAGVRIAGGFNMGAGGNLGLQAALLANILVPFGRCGLVGAQVTPGINVCENLWGAQVACFNHSLQIRGAQIGLANVASEVGGVQVGLVNFSDRGAGLQIGLLNFTEDSAWPWPFLRILQ